jgi:cell cycle arrest protein BUB3
MSEFQIEESPTDAISAVKFAPNNSQFLLASSWDRNVRLYDVDNNKLKAAYTHDTAVLDCCFTDMCHSFSGGLDSTLKMYDWQAQKETIVGTHTDAIKCVHYSPFVNLLITGSWDKTIKLWDPRVPTCVGSYEQPGMVYTLDTSDDRLVVGTANRKIRIWNLGNMGMPESRESSLKYQTRAIRCFPNKGGFVLSSIEGRVAVEYFDMSPDMQRRKYAFKCHRSKENGVELIYPVNAIAFHNVHNTFATGGCDSMVNIWDGFNKKRLCQFHSYPAGITSLAFDYTGNTLAIASSYSYEKGQLTTNIKDNIFIRGVSELETKPK